MNAHKEKRCALNPFAGAASTGDRNVHEHMRPRRIANDSEPSAVSYRSVRVVRRWCTARRGATLIAQ